MEQKRFGDKRPWEYACLGFAGSSFSPQHYKQTHKQHKNQITMKRYLKENEVTE